VTWSIVTALTATAAATAVLVWVIVSSPGLAMRTMTAELVGVVWLALAEAVAACSLPACWTTS
jgi:hypothetical protein